MAVFGASTFVIFSTKLPANFPGALADTTTLQFQATEIKDRVFWGASTAGYIAVTVAIIIISATLIAEKLPRWLFITAIIAANSGRNYRISYHLRPFTDAMLTPMKGTYPWLIVTKNSVSAFVGFAMPMQAFALHALLINCYAMSADDFKLRTKTPK
jgi:hypothetical protein